jgi:SAM-dependent methyltransferase
MAQIETGIRSLLSPAWAYRLWGILMGARRARRDFVATYLRTREGQAIFDIGCGPASILELLPEEIEYTGFDISPEYIASARRRFGDRGTFLQAAVGERPNVAQNHFDTAFSVGVLHHLDDDEARQLFELAHGALKPGGRLVTLDCGYTDDQPPLARWMASKDRGQNVRRVEEYEALARQTFETVETDVQHDRLRIPYTHIIMACTK